jgi:hypothetical protein
MERRALRDISVCRTGALGGHRDVCPNCGCERKVYNSCRNRHCPKCQALRQARWVAERRQRALPVRHFHVVFTLPAELRELVRAYEAPLLDLLFASAAETLLQLASDPKRLGSLLGITAVVHTWGRNLIFHPHLHCIVTGGGLDAEGEWVDSYEKYLLPVEVLRARFRGKFLDGLTRLFREGKLRISPRIPERVASLLEPATFAQLKDTLYGKNWVVFTKAPFKKPDALFRYLGLYTHRVAISNHRILHVDDDRVVFRTRDKKVCQLTPLEFMRRFLLHVLPLAFAAPLTRSSPPLLSQREPGAKRGITLRFRLKPDTGKPMPRHRSTSGQLWRRCDGWPAQAQKGESSSGDGLGYSSVPSSCLGSSAEARIASPWTSQSAACN